MWWIYGHYNTIVYFFLMQLGEIHVRLVMPHCLRCSSLYQVHIPYLTVTMKYIFTPLCIAYYYYIEPFTN